MDFERRVPLLTSHNTSTSTRLVRSTSSTHFFIPISYFDRRLIYKFSDRINILVMICSTTCTFRNLYSFDIDDVPLYNKRTTITKQENAQKLTYLLN